MSPPTERQLSCNRREQQQRRYRGIIRIGDKQDIQPVTVFLDADAFHFVRAAYTTVKTVATETVVPKISKNSLSYVGDTHVYVIKGPDGSLYKVGESTQGIRISDGASIRAEQQARKLLKETGDFYTTEIRQNFGGKADARAYETRFIVSAHFHAPFRVDFSAA